MAKFYPFPSIHQFKDNVRAVKETTTFTGCDENGKPQYDHAKPLPIENYIGFVKVHGTNAGIGYDPMTKTLWAQSRNHVLSDKSDNCGFHTFVMKNKDFLSCVLSQLSEDDKPIVAYGEWFGAGIQNNVAVATLQKRLMIFAVKIVDNSADSRWLGKDVIELFCSPEHFIWNVYTFPTYKITIDYNNLQIAQTTLDKTTYQVEKECPVGKYFGINGIGEGVVWYNEKYGRFKTKGNEHSSSKAITPASANNEKLASIIDFVEYAVTENRLNQGIEQVFTIYGERPDIKQTRKFITWITNDVFKEESGTLTENNLIPEDVEKAVANKAREWFTLFIKKLV
uniref:RNA ligase domain-containing protein n=1 Tax=viral metagenome TaxID=1070528 RepID=A0A6C0HI17_9ZZZZ